MDFHEVLSGYLANVSLYKDRMKWAQKNDNKELAQTTRLKLVTTIYNFNHMLNYITNKKEIYSRRECTPKEIKKYQKELSIEGDLIGMLDYRGFSFPIFLDNYGQQEYIEVYRKGKDAYTIYDGAYNFEPELDWIAQINFLFDMED